MKLKFTLFALAIAVSGGMAHAADGFGDTGVNGTIESWLNMKASTFPGISGAYPGGDAWTGPVESNSGATGTGGDADFIKTGGQGYFATGSLYSNAGSPFDLSPTSTAATYRISDATPLLNLETIVFQIQIAGPIDIGTPFVLGTSPVLSINGGAQNLVADVTGLAGRYINAGGGFGGNSVDTWYFQWDLSSLGPITSFTIDFAVTNHAQIYKMQVEQSDSYVEAVPEPSTLGLFGLGAAGLACLRRRSRKA